MFLGNKLKLSATDLTECFLVYVSPEFNLIENNICCTFCDDKTI